MVKPSLQRRSPAAVALSDAPRLADFGVILKPRVMSLVVFTAVVGLVLAPGSIDISTALAAIANVAIGAGAAGALNMWYDRDIDRLMSRTQNRPIPAGRMNPTLALAYGGTLAMGSVWGMATMVNVAAAALLALTILYYVLFYTMWLKRRTPQNIVIGGATGALPPVIGWAAVSGDVGWGALALFLIIFLWTPPHSWALALVGCRDYSRAGVPMMPVVAGEKSTKRQIMVYMALLIPASFLPVFVGMSGLPYAMAAGVLGILFTGHTLRLYRDETNATAWRTFKFSILYLFLIFVALLADHAITAFS